MHLTLLFEKGSRLVIVSEDAKIQIKQAGWSPRQIHCAVLCWTKLFISKFPSSGVKMGSGKFNARDNLVLHFQSIQREYMEIHIQCEKP